MTKDSGGTYTWSKMRVAGELGIPVVIVRREPAPRALEVVDDALAAAAWIGTLASR